jgi:hypothetical protein
VAVDFLTINPSLYGSPTGYLTQTDPQCATAGQYPSYPHDGTTTVVCTSFPSTGIGPVADGWLPGDPFNCGTGGGVACSGTAYTNITNTPTNGGTGATSAAYRLFCAHGPSSTPDSNQITDWGQLTNLSAAANGGTAQPVGDGAPIGVPIRIIGINPGSGTVATFYAFAQSGIGTPPTGSNCAGGVGTVSSADVDVNAASGPDPLANQGPLGATGNNEIALENDSNQIGDFAAADWIGQGGNPANCDSADQAVDIATSLYSMSFGAYVSNPNAEVTSIENPTTGPSACSTNTVGANPSTFTEKFGTANGHVVSINNERNNSFPMARTVFNIYRTDTVRDSVAGFLNWFCDSNAAIQKGTDHILGGNFDTDVTNIINGQFAFSRLTDATPELPINSQTPADNVPSGGPNGTCDARLPIQTSPVGITAGSATITLTNPVPSSVQVGWTVSVPPGSSVSVAGDTVSSISGNTITLNNVVATGTTGAPTPTFLYFPGQAPVLATAVHGS